MAILFTDGLATIGVGRSFPDFRVAANVILGGLLRASFAGPSRMATAEQLSNEFMNRLDG